MRSVFVRLSLRRHHLWRLQGEYTWTFGIHEHLVSMDNWYPWTFGIYEVFFVWTFGRAWTPGRFLKNHNNQSKNKIKFIPSQKKIHLRIIKQKFAFTPPMVCLHRFIHRCLVSMDTYFCIWIIFIGTFWKDLMVIPRGFKKVFLRSLASSLKQTNNSLSLPFTVGGGGGIVPATYK